MLALIEARFDTRMWNEGFEHAREPWATAYTHDDVVADYYVKHARVSIPDPAYDASFPQDYNIRVLRLDEGFQPPAVKTFEHLTPQKIEDDNDYEVYDAAKYLGVLTGESAQQIRRFHQRLLAWDGI